MGNNANQPPASRAAILYGIVLHSALGTCGVLFTVGAEGKLRVMRCIGVNKKDYPSGENILKIMDILLFRKFLGLQIADLLKLNRIGWMHIQK